MQRPNALRWDGGPGHYEVWYLSLTDPGSATGVWIRYTLRAPSDGSPGECALWLMAMGRGGGAPTGGAGWSGLGRKRTLPIAELHARDEPFHLTVGDAELSDRGMAGGFDDVAWELSWEPSAPAPDHVHPLLRRARVAKTVLTLPHPDLAVTGTVRLPGGELRLDGARGGQAHLWGSKHAGRWAWLHASDLAGLDGAPRRGSWLDGVSVVVPRLGRELGRGHRRPPAVGLTPVVGRLLGDDFRATAPLRVLRAPSRFGLTSWGFEAVDGKRRVVAEVDAPRESLVGVVYHDPDGQRAWCYNSEVASMRAVVWDRSAPGRFGWMLRDTLVADGTAHFEYAQRSPVDGVEVLVGG